MVGVKYRVNNVAEAKAKALSYGSKCNYTGVMFPWSVYASRTFGFYVLSVPFTPQCHFAKYSSSVHLFATGRAARRG